MLAKKCTLCGEFLYSPWRKIVQFILPFTHINKFIAPSFYDHDNDDTHTNKRGRGSDKTPVVGMIDRNNKKVFSKIALPNGKGQRLTANQLMDLLKQVSKQENKNTIMNDEFKGYDPLSKNDFIYLRVDHQHDFSDKHGTHTNNIESFWATLKPYYML